MNIIVIVSDTFRRDFLGRYGNDWIRTPNLDRFARRSIIFDKAYAGSFPTVPQRYDLFTGRYCFHTTGWAPLDPNEETLPRFLKSTGYHTTMINDTAHIVTKTMNYYKDFNEWEHVDRRNLPEAKNYASVPCSLSKLRFPKEADLYSRLITRKEDEHFCAQTMMKAAEWLEKKAKDYNRFLLYVDTFDPHEPWTPPDEYVNLYDPEYEGEVVFSPRYDYSDYLNESELRHMRALYAGMVTLVDKWVGLLLTKVEELGLSETTAVIFTSDHGFYHGEHKRIGKHTVLDPKDGWPLYEEVNHIPLMMSIPDMPKSRTCNALVQPVDITTTILELAGVQIPKDLHGQSILPVLWEEKTRIRDIAVSATGPYFQPNIAQPPPHIRHDFVLSSDPEYVSYSTITDGEWALLYAGVGTQTELYDLRGDPKQECNVISSNLETAERLHRRYYDFLKNIGANEGLLRIRQRL